MKIKSKIKQLFCDELLNLCAVTCDTMRINSSQHKMLIIQQLLKKYNIPFSVLGGATNRIALYIDRYAVKFAVDHQGYVDNLVEYSISRELQPYVTKSYETNGYILVAESVKTMSLDDFKMRRTDIETILSNLAQDYLLGDVGIISRNYTNWGIRDNGEVVILDYAYIHRGTEKLFTCEVCGCGILRYDATFTKLKCSNPHCNAEFTYTQRKAVQGDQIDLDMIEECKSYSIKFERGISEKELFENEDGTYSGKRKITTFNEYLTYLKEVNNMMSNNYDASKVAELLTKLSIAKTDDEKKSIQNQLDELVREYASDEEDVNIEYDSVFDGINMTEESDDNNEENTQSDDIPDSYFVMGTSDLIKYINSHENDTSDTESEQEPIEEESDYETGDDIVRRMMNEKYQASEQPVVEKEPDKDIPVVETEKEPEPEQAHTEELTKSEETTDVEENVVQESEPVIQSAIVDNGVYLNGEKL